jgi:hypothetical protein
MDELNKKKITEVQWIHENVVVMKTGRARTCYDSLAA